MKFFNKLKFINFILKRNILARINSTPAFRYFRHFVNGNTPIGAIPIAFNTQNTLTHISFRSYATTLLLIFGLLVFITPPALAQNKQETVTRIASVKKAKFSLTDNVEHFTFRAKKAAIYNILVLSPIADIISKPIKNKPLKAEEELKFSINTKYWKPGTYRIFIQIDGVTIEQRKIFIQRNKHKR